MQRLPITLAVASLAALLNACTPFGTTTEGVETVTDSVTGVLESSTPSDSYSGSFVQDRFESIRLEAARGEGENVEALGALLGETDNKAFARWMKDNYSPLFAGLKAPQELVDRIRARRVASL